MILLLLTACGIDWSDANTAWADRDHTPTWDWILSAELPSPPPALDLIGVDAFDAPEAWVREASAQGTAVWCYLSIGSSEDWRPDHADFVAADEANRASGGPGLLGNTYDGWPGENWLNIAEIDALLPLMEARLDLCASKGFSLVEYDNMEIDGETAGFPFSQADAVAWTEAVLDATAARGLGAVHKNATSMIDLEPRFEMILLESCQLWDFCGETQPYLDADKPVLNVEYPSSWTKRGRAFSTKAACERPDGVSTIVKRRNLDEDIYVCP